MNAADHASEGKNSEHDPGRTTDCETFNWRPVEEQPGECDKRTDDCEQTGEQPRRGAGAKRKAMHAGKISRCPNGHNRNCNQRESAVKFTRATNLETQPAPVRGGFDPLGHLYPPAWFFLLLLTYAVACAPPPIPSI